MATNKKSSYSYHDVFGRFVPEAAVPYCVQLYEYYGFEFKIKKARGTKLGDYRFDPINKLHTITVNNDLNPYAFLITYLHEVAHLANRIAHGNQVSPHGEEWKICFVRIAKPMMNDMVFPPEVLKALHRYFKNPKAASCSDVLLTETLRGYDNQNGKVLLKQLKPGDRFTFNDKQYLYLEKRRTRILCEQMPTKRKYLIGLIAEVEKIDPLT